MRLEQYLIEIMTTKVELNIGHTQKDLFDAQFDVDNYKYEFEAYMTSKTEGGYEIWEIIFRRMDFTGPSQYEITGDLDKKQVLTVFSGVKQAGEIFLKKYKPEIFMFSAKEPKRIKIYRLLAKKISTWFPKYEYDGEKNMGDQGTGFFWYKK